MRAGKPSARNQAPGAPWRRVDGKRSAFRFHLGFVQDEPFNLTFLTVRPK